MASDYATTVPDRQPLRSVAGRARARLAATACRMFGLDTSEGLGRDAAAVFAVRVFSAALLYLSQVLLARWMGGHEYGIYVAVWSVVLALSSLSQLGFNTALIRLLPEYRERGDLDLLRGILLGSRALSFAAATAIAAAGAVLAMTLGPASNSPYVWPLVLILACLPMCALSDVQDGIGRGNGWLVAALAPPYVLRPLFVLVALITARLLDLPMQASTACVAAIVATWAATLVQFALIEHQLRRTVPAGSRRYQLAAWLRIALPLLAIGFADVVLQTADVLVISRFLAPDQVAIYFAAAKTMSLVMFVHYAVGSAVARQFSALNARGDRAQLERVVAQAVRWTFWPSLAATLVILALGWPLLSLFGPGFTDAYPAMAVLAGGFLLRSAFGPAEFLLNMHGEQRACAIVLLSAAAVAVALNVVLVPWFGILGAAIATALAVGSAAIANGRLARRRLGVNTFILAVLMARPEQLPSERGSEDERPE